MDILSLLLQACALFVLVPLAGKVILKSINHRVARRAGADPAELVEVPCRISWESGFGTRSFVYGKAMRSESGIVFRRRFRGAVEIPMLGRTQTRTSWRIGMLILSYRTPKGEDIEILLHEGDVPLVRRYLQTP